MSLIFPIVFSFHPMFWDAVPLVSQVKSLVQACSGDMQGALETQENFSRQCPVVSQCRSLVHAVQGDNDQALKVQEEFATGPGLSMVQGAAVALTLRSSPILSMATGAALEACKKMASNSTSEGGEKVRGVLDEMIETQRLQTNDLKNIYVKSSNALINAKSFN